MMFLGRDWLGDMVNIMEKNPKLYLLTCEKCKGQANFIEPVSGKRVDTGEHLSTWLFCIRTSLREHIKTSFISKSKKPDKEGQNIFFCDIGDRLLEEMRRKNLSYAYMSWWVKVKYHHFGNLS